MRLKVIKNTRAKRYLLRLSPDESVRLTIPRRGTVAYGRAFAEKQTGWLATQLEKLLARTIKSREWFIDTEILFRGEWIRLILAANEKAAIFGNETVLVGDVRSDLRPAIEKHLWKLAAKELPPRVFEFAQTHNLKVSRVSIRNQKTRWGSCSQRGTIALNWRLVQAPPYVSDYIILHELMHLRQMNHSARYWSEVATVCPEYAAAERWLKQNAALLK